MSARKQHRLRFASLLYGLWLWGIWLNTGVAVAPAAPPEPTLDAAAAAQQVLARSFDNSAFDRADVVDTTTTTGTVGAITSEATDVIAQFGCSSYRDF